ncbi:MFS-type transporter SLC18B1-like isoform X2 [Tachypleus tridentatus]|uniref:MFS-type transporter SLC18B1-like isoform X2 n=1 Tax=Tachypleus tridentatus TaxID=6853 RepID=UPI003FD6334F
MLNIQSELGSSSSCDVGSVPFESGNQSINVEESADDSPTVKTSLTRQQLSVLVIVNLSLISLASCYALLAPFFPKLAEKKGATSIQYGLVFGVFNLVILITSPVISILVPFISSKVIAATGVFVTGTCSVLFGTLNLSPHGTTFIVLAFAVRIVEAFGSASMFTVAYSIVGNEFTNRRATALATMDMSFGVGIIIGPSIGGVLYEVGGYMLPFFVLGGILLFQGFIMMFLLPESECIVENTKGDFRKIVFNSVFLVDMLNVLTTLLFLGFIEATLEPHIRPFGLQPSILGLIFIICGGFYAGSSLIWGCIFDKFPTSLLPLFISSAFCAASFIFVGPAPFIPLDTSLWLVIFSQIILGIGIGGKSIIGLNHSLRHTISQGLPDNMSTVAIVSGVFNSVNAFGSLLRLYTACGCSQPTELKTKQNKSMKNEFQSFRRD